VAKEQNQWMQFQMALNLLSAKVKQLSLATNFCL
jgi:hypothetical protein